MNFFQKEEVIALDKIQQYEISKILYNYWVNVAKGEEVSILDSVQLIFVNAQSLSLSGRMDECIKIVSVDIDKDRKELLEQFQGKIVIRSEDMTNSPFWENAKIINWISLRKNEKGEYLNDAILLNCEKKEIVIFYDGGGLSVEEVFEELDD